MTKQIEVDITIKVLCDTRALLEQGWCQGAARRLCSDGSMAYCVGRALHVALGGYDSKSKLDYVRISNIVARAALPFGTIHDIPGWNDDPGRTKKEVLAVMDKAIALSLGLPESDPAA